ncbi:MAG: hypothetical protein V9G23_02945 [Giesbergeria sp.]
MSAKPSAIGVAGNKLGGERNVIEQIRENTRCFGVLRLLIEDIALNRHDLVMKRATVSHH